MSPNPGLNHFSSRSHPDSFELDRQEDVRGIIRETIYGGNEIEAVLEAGTRSGPVDLQVHIHPGEKVREGSELRFHVLPEFVAVIEPAPTKGETGRLL